MLEGSLLVGASAGMAEREHPSEYAQHRRFAPAIGAATALRPSPILRHSTDQRREQVCRQQRNQGTFHSPKNTLKVPPLRLWTVLCQESGTTYPLTPRKLVAPLDVGPIDRLTPSKDSRRRSVHPRRPCRYNELVEDQRSLPRLLPDRRRAGHGPTTCRRSDRNHPRMRCLWWLCCLLARHPRSQTNSAGETDAVGISELCHGWLRCSSMRRWSPRRSGCTSYCSGSPDCRTPHLKSVHRRQPNTSVPQRSSHA